MAKYRLSKAAKVDLVVIAQYGDDQFGITQSNNYRDKLKKRFAELAAQPMLYPAVSHIKSGYRRSVCRAHSIYYRIKGQNIEIMRVLGRQDTDNAL